MDLMHKPSKKIAASRSYERILNRQPSHSRFSSAPTYYAPPYSEKPGDPFTYPNFEQIQEYLKNNYIKEYITSAELDTNQEILPDRNHLFTKIKVCFMSERNCNTLIAKILATNTPGVSDPEAFSAPGNNYRFYKNYRNEIRPQVIKVFENLAEPIAETLNDIYYWVSKNQGTTINNISLTDSDIHSRGVGVCIVEYETTNQEKKNIVIKPEIKSFEKAVYGKDNEKKNLADKFNELLRRGLLGKGMKQARIGTLDIQISANEAHGSAVEYLAHKRFEDVKDESVDSQSIRALIAFCSLLGLADLHTENLVYHQPDPNSKYLPQLIDAEVGMSYALPNDSPLKAAAEQTYGQMVCNGRIDLNSIPLDILNDRTLTKIDPDLLKEFFDAMRMDLSTLSSRFILIGTSALFEARHKYLTINDLNNTDEVNDWRDFYRKLLQNGKSNLELKGFTITESTDEDQCIDWAIDDFAKGRIPFFQINHSTGDICQEGHTICKICIKGSEDRSSFLNGVIENRAQTLIPKTSSMKLLAILGGAAGLAAGVYMLWSKFLS